MKKVILVLTMLVVSLFGNNQNVTKQEVGVSSHKIKNNIKITNKKNLMDNLFNVVNDDTLGVEEILSIVNRYVNRNFKYIEDTNDGVKSYSNFIKDDGGDCEDFAYIKSYILKQLLSAKKINIEYNFYICNTKNNTLHCILEVTSNGTKYYLDNIAGDIKTMNHITLEKAHPKYAKLIRDGLIKRYNVAL